MPPPPNRSATCASPRDPAWAATACPSTRATSRGRCAGRLGQPFRFVELANDVNEHMPDYVVRRLLLAFNRMGRAVNGSRILLLGLAYKRNTGDAREAPGTVIAQSLAALGAEVRVVDPHLSGESVPYPLVELTAEELAAARRRWSS